jgi:Protein of unknown function (DUF1580)
LAEHRGKRAIDPGVRPALEDDAENRSSKTRTGTGGPNDPSPRLPGYQIVLGRDTIVTLTQATGLIPPRRRGRKTSVSTLFRWSTSGCRGILLPTLQCGGTRCTSVEAIQWFFEALTELSRSPGAEATSILLRRSPSRRRRESEDAGKRLEQMGA